MPARTASGNDCLCNSDSLLMETKSLSPGVLQQQQKRLTGMHWSTARHVYSSLVYISFKFVRKL